MQPIVRTRQGAVRGVRGDSGVAAFKGIPFAAPPVGPLRLAAPRPPAAWDGVRDATAYGPTVPHAPYVPPFDRLIPEAHLPGDDCLNLNVWTPDPAGRLPVMVWVHGGAFANGSGSVAGYDGTAFARDGVVLVTLNYRLGADGFLHLDGTPGNRGLLDQIAALEWVRDNIAAFGGDPDRVTVFGESAGAMSIGALLAMPRAEGLFRRAVLQSGAAHHSLTRATARRVTDQLARMLGVPATSTALAAVPTERLLTAQQKLRAAVTARPDPELWGEVVHNLMPFEPVVDGDTLPRAPADVLARAAETGTDLLVGTNSDEFRLFVVPTGVIGHVTEEALRRTAAGYGLDPDRALAVYREQRPGASPGDLLAALVTDWFYRVPALRLAEAHAGHRPGGVFLYEFAWRPPTFDGRLGAAHATELPFVFDNLGDEAFVPLLGPAPPRQIADAMHGAWVSFATTGTPGWPAYTTGTRTTMRFDTVSRAVDDPRPQERAVWEGVR